MVTVAQLIDYLQQCDGSLPVVLDDGDVESRGDYVSLRVALSECADEDDIEASPDAPDA